MKLNILAVSALLALVAAETTTTADKVTTTTSAEVECAKNCAAKDICCTAKCYKVPCPSDSQANDTNECVSKCPQGTGTPEDTKKYSDCQQACFSSHYFPIDGTTATGTAGTAATASGSEATQTGSDSSNDSGNSSKGTGTASGSASGTTETGAANTSNAANAKLGASGAGLFGLVLAAFAL
ncbi:hypothetical protein N7532_010891 [Penicillium argentinense]|uniref:Uncharacterized protein n=1 Tax=Penicillium argentinense TaxID=1131581 RepID=A0A9W9EQQ3_9EURO|nr:uncharacterized protein N7532_010891 [Penicillium argentinense]KAJ5086120.1 hypothetical protein N7532_010891 [Penicillium argentinense]